MGKGFACGSMIFQNMFVDVLWVQTAHVRETGGLCLQNRLRRNQEDRFPGPGWGLQPLIVLVAMSLINTSSFVELHPSLSAGRTAAVASAVMKSFGFLVTQKQWVKCKQSPDRIPPLDPSFHTWLLWLQRRDKLCNIVLLSPDALITCSKAFTEATSEMAWGTTWKILTFFKNQSNNDPHFLRQFAVKYLKWSILSFFHPFTHIWSTLYFSSAFYCDSSFLYVSKIYSGEC